MSRASKPLLFGDAITDTVAAVEGSPFLYEVNDPSYVPGYSEVVRANDAAKGRMSEGVKQKLYAQFGTGPKELPVRFAWVRVAGLDGNTNPNVQIAAAEWRRRGYQPATLQDLEKYGYSPPPTAHVAADGTIRREDVALWIVDGARAKALDEHFRRVNEDFHALKPTMGADTGAPIDVLEQHRDPDFTV